MVHYGKHIIDPATGLCEICDRGAIHDFRKGKRPGKKQFLYSNQDGRFTYRAYDEEEEERNYEEPKPRHVRKPAHPEPLPTRTRPAVYEQPLAVQKKVTRRDHSPYDEHDRPSPSRPATFYYVDNTGQMYPRNEAPPEEPRRHHLEPTHQSLPTTRSTRSTRVAPRRAQTPPPPASETWRSHPKRQHDSATEIIDHHHKPNQHEPYFNHSPRKAEMYYLEGGHNNNHYTALNSLVPQTHHDHTPSPRANHHNDTVRKQRHLEPIERKHYVEPEPTVKRKVYKKLPPNRYEQPEEEYIPNGHHTRPTRKIEKIYPTARHYDSSPQVTNRHVRSPLENKYASMFHLQSIDGY
jgi:hypothetical protein